MPFGPGAGFDFAIVGESSYLGTLRRAGGQRLAAGETVVLEMLIVPEPENQFDENAVAVHAKGFGKVGYFSRDDAQEWAVVMAGLKILGGVATCEGWLRGGTGDKKNIGVWLSIKGVDEIEAEMAGWTT